MIKEVYIKNVATFTQSEANVLSSLSKINFFYGTNGSGKTTISRVIENCQKYPDCNLVWEGKETEIFVYNEEFVQGNFLQSEIQGVFTLGEKAKQIEEEMQGKVEGIAKIKEKLDNFEKSQEQKIQEKQDAINSFSDSCWWLKGKYENEKYRFHEAFRGYRDSKEKFKEKLLTYLEREVSEPKTIEYLKEKAETVFANNPQRVIPPEVIDTSKLEELEKNEVLSVKIIGKEDINISALISKLGNSDWVKAGIQYFEKSEDVCPFCQQSTLEISLKAQLEKYFDETFSSQMEQLTRLQHEYETTTDQIIAGVQQVLRSDNPFIDKDTLSDKLDVLLTQKELNENIISEKLEKPSLSFSLESSEPTLQDINEIIRLVSERSLKHNETVSNLEDEKELLKEQIWQFIADEISPEHKRFLVKKNNIQKGIDGIQKATETHNSKLKKAERELQKLESTITSVAPTTKMINGMLRDFGFTNFSITESSSKQGFYEVLRPDGKDAKKTLSEGEKTFLTFLYFYQRVKGSNTSTGTTSEKIVVFDDPISSLDSNILFIVSSLIRNLIDDIKNGDGYIKQVFVLTHNVYFHKEVSFKYEGNNIKHFLLKKDNGLSSAVTCERNPVQSSYQLLWDEVRNGNGLNIRNAMRRILETYFQHYGDTKLEDIYKEFEGDKQIVCRSLISWIHDGSHSITDDLFVNYGEDLVIKYKDVFREIFEKKNHIAHYNMMMKIAPI